MCARDRVVMPLVLGRCSRGPGRQSDRGHRVKSQRLFSTSVSFFLKVREAILTTSLLCGGHVWRNTDILCLPAVFAGLRKVSGEVENV